MEFYSSARPHVVAVPFFMPGHTAPLLHLCRHLVSWGCKVTLLKVPDDIDKAGTSEWDNGVEILSALPLSLPPSFDATQDNLEKLLDRFLGTSNEFRGLGDVVHRTIEELSEKGPRVTSIVSDVLVEWAQEVANRSNIRWIAFWTSTVAELLIYYHMPRLIAEGVFPFAGEESDKLITSIPGIPALGPKDYPSFGYIKQASLLTILHTYKDVIQRLPKAERVLANSIYELEKGPMDSLKNISNINIYSVGPLHVLSGDIEQNSEEESVIQWLDRKPKSSVLYIAFGTTMPMPADQFKELALALEETGQAFIWVIRQSIPTLIPQGFQERMISSNQGLIVGWAPQLAVLKHASVGGFFTHCGWNSVLESISTGMPLISRPISGDQMLTRKFLVEEWGIAVGLDALGLEGADPLTAVSDKENIKRVIKALMEESAEGARVRKKCIEMKELVKEAMGEKGSSWSSLNLLVHDLQEWSKQAVHGVGLSF